LLALSPQDALVLKHLKDSGAVIDIVLRAPTSNQNFELDPVMPDYLIDRYRLEVTR
jgi:pilus assembly protein CpaB